jgi:uncharacterized membrane protein YidH (DUF202 family)
MSGGLRDPGAQPERTTLAWQRTTLALIVAGLLCVRLAPSTTTAALAAATVCGAISLQLRRALKRHPRHPRHPPRHPADPVSILLATALTVLFAVMGMLLALQA